MSINVKFISKQASIGGGCQTSRDPVVTGGHSKFFSRLIHPPVKSKLNDTLPPKYTQKIPNNSILNNNENLLNDLNISSIPPNENMKIIIANNNNNTNNKNNINNNIIRHYRKIPKMKAVIKVDNPNLNKKQNNNQNQNNQIQNSLNLNNHSRNFSAAIKANNTCNKIASNNKNNRKKNTYKKTSFKKGKNLFVINNPKRTNTNTNTNKNKSHLTNNLNNTNLNNKEIKSITINLSSKLAQINTSSSSSSKKCSPLKKKLPPTGSGTKTLPPPKKNPLQSQNLENLIINNKYKAQNNFSKDEYLSMFTKYIRDDYESPLMSTLFTDELVDCPKDFLLHHKITERMRMRMVDWMIEVLSNYRCDEQTYFESISIMDRYFNYCEKKRKILEPEELHLIGVTSMFIASKYHDIYPLRIKIVQEKIAHNRLSGEEIRQKEDEIMTSLGFVLGLPNLWDFICYYIEEIFFNKINHYHIKNQTLIENYYNSNNNNNITNKDNNKKNDNDNENECNSELNKEINKLYTKNMINLLKYVCIYLAKMNCHDYILIQKRPSLLAASTIFVGIKICEQINKVEYVNEYFSNKLNDISKTNEQEMIEIAQKILYNAQNFDTIFNGLENLKKVYFNAIIELKETK